MCAEAGLTKDFSNHSLRAYGAMTLFQAKVLEKLRTGHKSLEALRSYERTSESQLIDVSHLVYNTNAPDDACTEIFPFNNDDTYSEMVPFNNSHTKTSSNLVDTRDQKENKEGNNSILPLLNTATTNIPNIVITGCNFINCNVSLYSKFNNSDSEEATVDKASISELLKGLTPEQLFDN